MHWHDEARGLTKNAENTLLDLIIYPRNDNCARKIKIYLDHFKRQSS